MKKITVILLLIIALCVPTYAETNINLDDMSYEELLDLRNQIDIAISKYESSTSKEVRVPQGVYIIGVKGRT